MTQVSAANVLVVGSFMMDLIVRTPRLPKEGETIIGTEFGRAPGGKGANQAMAAARLGASVTMVGRVGNDLFGEEQIRSLGSAGIDTTYIYKDDNAPTGVGSITLDQHGNNRIVIVPGANMEVTPEDVDRAQDAFAKADIILLQLEIPLEVNRYVLQQAKKLGKAVILNPAPAQELDSEILESVTVLTPNESEAELLTGIATDTMDGVKAAAAALRERGIDNVVITLGDKGALMVTPEHEEVVPSWSVEAVDTTAAGDAFNGALAVGLAQGKPWQEAVRFANAVGALAVTKFGAQPSIPTLHEVEAFLKERS